MSGIKERDQEEFFNLSLITEPRKELNDVVSAVMVLLKENTSWDSARQILSSDDFKTRVLYFDRKNISDETLSNL